MGEQRDPEDLEYLGFELEASPLADGTMMVINGVPPTEMQYAAVALMTLALLLALCLKRKHPQFRPWAIGLFASCVHNTDNILRPGTYLTPSWIVRPYVSFPMEVGFVFWLVVMSLGIFALHTPPNKIFAVLHSAGTSFGIMHYRVAKDLSRFSVIADSVFSFSPRSN